MGNTRRNYVGGEWVESSTGETFESTNPADPSDSIGTFQQSGAADVDEAVGVAATAGESWAARPAPERGEYLRRVAAAFRERDDELTEALTREEGKVLAEARGEVERSIDILYYYAERVRDFGAEKKAPTGRNANLYTVREPLGVVGLLTAWNYPLVIPVWKIAPAVASGNAVVFKPATNAPDVTRRAFECFDEADLPDGVVNYVTGPGSVVGDAISSHPDVAAVSFTGSTAVGHGVYDAAAADMKRVQTEMGGKNPTVVSDAADLDAASSIVASGAFGVTGQACTATSRALVYEDVYDEFVARVVEEAEAIDVGPGLDGGEMGPQVSAAELDGTLEYVDVGQRDGATLETGGGELDRDGYFVEPTVFSGVEPDMTIAREEIFGPVLSVIEVSGFDEAIAVANDVEYGLSAAIVTRDHTEANEFVEAIEAGVVKINEQTTGTDLHVPFGGFKESSSDTYREQGDEALRFYTSTKTVYENY